MRCLRVAILLILAFMAVPIYAQSGDACRSFTKKSADIRVQLDPELERELFNEEDGRRVLGCLSDMKARYPQIWNKLYPSSHVCFGETFSGYACSVAIKHAFESVNSTFVRSQNELTWEEELEFCRYRGGTTKTPDMIAACAEKEWKASIRGSERTSDAPAFDRRTPAPTPSGGGSAIGTVKSFVGNIFTVALAGMVVLLLWSMGRKAIKAAATRVNNQNPPPSA